MSDSGGEEDAASAGSGAPPPVAPQQVSADHLRSTHPLWQKAAGKGGGGGSASGGKGRGKAAQAGGDGGGATRFEPLSALALEIDCFRANADGDSALFSDEGGSMAAPPRKRRAESAHADLFGEEDEEDDEDGGGFSALAPSEAYDEGAHPAKKRSKGKSTAASGDAAMYAQAAFGTGYAGGDSDGESVSQVSATESARKKAAYRAAFPVKGIECVGCMLTKQISPVIKFVKDNLEKMSEEVSVWNANHHTHSGAERLTLTTFSGVVETSGVTIRPERAGATQEGGCANS
tara:strand:+ start:8258 stop:9127 length:870 start_codon:yes stop_codon:yes gene_type:complete